MDISSLNSLNSSLLPGMASTNSTNKGAQILSDEASFQAKLQAAQESLNSTQPKAKIMTEEEVAARNQAIKDASVQFESIFLKMMLNEMWKTVPQNTLFGENENAMGIYRDMYHEKLAIQMAENGGIGLADFMYNNLVRRETADIIEPPGESSDMTVDE